MPHDVTNGSLSARFVLYTVRDGDDGRETSVECYQLIIVAVVVRQDLIRISRKATSQSTESNRI